MHERNHCNLAGEAGSLVTIGYPISGGAVFSAFNVSMC
jgi:hypothetical protein